MKNQKIIGALVIVLVIAGLSFLGGMKYANSKSSSSSFAANIPNGFNQNGTSRTGNGMMRGVANSGGFVSGQVISKDDKSLTVQLGGNNGGAMQTQSGSKIVFYSPTTTVEKTVSGTATDVSTGNQVIVVGTANSDGSVNATSIQIRSVPVNNNPIK